ncbi:NAD-dependent epimerase/dehydratase family protein [Clostridium perfringens]|uniref:NAD-dependent epimerase/dehydratase family protein n=1 Tax=Clostridium perfringens TaxID=1502 RepID=UPI001ABB132E|nr:NAD(P)-dependent oxidoreductase [Clostridium perfringens]MBO3342211.1 NAD(P)-dependent oxidoreductase [Clostridium perfringens]
MKKIVIFGATGNLGAYVVDYFLENFDKDKFEIIAVGRRETEFFKKLGIKYYKVDISKKDMFDILPNEDVYSVVDLAGIMPAQMKGYDPYKYVDINITGTLNVLEYCRVNNVDRILFTQTEADLKGYWGKEKIIRPDMTRNFSKKGYYALYVISKSTAVDLIKNYNEDYGIKAFIFRLPTVYCYKPSPYYYVNGEKKLLGYRQLIDKAINGEDIELWGDPNKAKDIVYVKDFAQMLYKAILVDKDYGMYNVGTGKAVTLEEQINGIIEVFSNGEKKSKIIYCPDKPDAREFIMDIENAKKELGYKPKYSYIEYLRDFKKEMELNRFRELRGE